MSSQCKHDAHICSERTVLHETAAVRIRFSVKPRRNRRAAGCYDLALPRQPSGAMSTEATTTTHRRWRIERRDGRWMECHVACVRHPDHGIVFETQTRFDG